MASMSSLPLLYLPLLLLLPQLSHSAPIPQPKNLAHQKPQPWNTYIVHANHLAKPPHFATLGHWYTSMVDSHSPRAAVTVDSSRILYTYDTVMHGFAVQITGDEARRLSGAVGVTGVYEDRLLHLQTTRSPGFLGLDPGFGAWRDTNLGNGVIIGFVDSGIWPESPSFNDHGLGPVRSSWRGKCVGAENFDANLCNNKLVGIKTFDKLVPSPRDVSGHGTHVASTAAGSEVRDTGILMFARGTARGVGPKARIAMYKIVVCTDSDDWKIEIVPQVGAAGLILVDNSSWSPDGTIFSSAFTLPENRAPTVASFSSRGPSPVVPELLKPDVIAPGVNILAAWPGSASLANPRNSSYQLDAGTSIACPQVAGVAALIKEKHGTWTPAMMRSKLMTTAGTLDNTDREIPDSAVVDRVRGGATAATPFATGAGPVRPQLALDPDLVYDASSREYIDFLCALNYTTEQLRRFAPDLATCARELPGGPAGLNYPSFVVVFDVRTLTRTVTKVSEGAEKYKVTVAAPEHVNVTVTQATLEFKEQYEKRS
ncbi:Subtilisin-like protease SBT1.8 [Dichanthelium oligosanthes]|uniref:Subtilisin-like protease SBT1.8 n=1 Tax=Dichanthelium oligosanthes TaxID=888268 RepID=A0A1E5UJC8_9POAL|nr:Subtilisin-like protease SBT1.8 [Dichanthelium oligosanthes]